MTEKKRGHALQPGTLLRSNERTYEIVKVLGSGSFGITYLAKWRMSVGNITNDVFFAIKEHFLSASCYRGEDGSSVHTVPTAQTDVRNSRADFLNEARRLKELCKKSRGIVAVNEAFEANGTAYYVMEFLDGGSPGKCSEPEAVKIVLQLADALEAIHSEKLLHLDVKPDNIVMKRGDDGETFPVLIDFGIAKHFDSKGNPTSSLGAKGASPGYAPQEQYAGISEFSPKYDVYALGAVLFFLITGQNPPDAFKVSPNQQELKAGLAGKVSPNVECAILNAMKPNVSERTASITQFRNELNGVFSTPVVKQGGIIKPDSDTISTGGSTKVIKRDKSRKKLYIGTAVFTALALTIVLLMLLFSRNEENLPLVSSSTPALISPDREFFNVKGNVKTITYTGENSLPLLTDFRVPIEFDENGVCTNFEQYLYSTNWTNGIELRRNGKGEVIKATSTSSTSYFDFTWNKGIPTKIELFGKNKDEDYILTYSDGVISNVIRRYEIRYEGGGGETEVNLGDFKFDDNGNWTECRGKVADKRFTMFSMDTTGEKETISTDEITIKRTITYY